MLGFSWMMNQIITWKARSFHHFNHPILKKLPFVTFWRQGLKVFLGKTQVPSTSAPFKAPKDDENEMTIVWHWYRGNFSRKTEILNHKICVFFFERYFSDFPFGGGIFRLPAPWVLRGGAFAPIQGSEETYPTFGKKESHRLNQWSFLVLLIGEIGTI